MSKIAENANKNNEDQPNVHKNLKKRYFFEKLETK